MDLKDLEVFLAITRFGSINKAAEALFLAQSTVTHRLKQLEAHLHTTLFVRTKNGVMPTPEGRQFVPIATSVVEQLRSFTETTGTKRPLTIAAGRGFAAYELPRLLGAYRMQHPDFICYVKSALYEESVQTLLTGTADLALMGNEVYHPQLRQIPLPSDNIVLIVSPAHRWAKGFTGFQEWGTQEMIAFASSSAPLRQRTDKFLAMEGVHPNVIMELDSFGAIKKMVAQNLGVAMLPYRIVEEELKDGIFVAHDIAKGRLTRPTMLVYPHYKENDPEFQMFVDWIQEAY